MITIEQFQKRATVDERRGRVIQKILHLPRVVIRLDRERERDTNLGFKWHAINEKKTKTLCGVILYQSDAWRPTLGMELRGRGKGRHYMNARHWQAREILRVKSKDLCKQCFRGVEIADMTGEELERARKEQRGREREGSKMLRKPEGSAKQLELDLTQINRLDLGQEKPIE